MELREIWALLRRRWLVIVIPTAVVLAIGLITYRAPGPLYNAGVRFIVGQAPIESAAASPIEPTVTEWL